MTRIHDSSPTFDRSIAPGVEAIRPPGPKSTEMTAVKRRTVDEVHVSADAQLASSAIAAIRKAPDIRPAAVERAKALLAAGEVGTDASRLAGKLIDRALDSSRPL